jgi:hypothetical protein
MLFSVSSTKIGIEKTVLSCGRKLIYIYACAVKPKAFEGKERLSNVYVTLEGVRLHRFLSC